MFFILFAFLLLQPSLSFSVEKVKIGKKTFFITKQKDFILYKDSLYPNRKIFLYKEGTEKDNINKQWYLTYIKAPVVWHYTKGENVIVAILDSGISLYHKDLRDNIWKNRQEDWIDDKTPGYNGLDDDHNGIIDDYYGYNAIMDNNNIQDDNGHGTYIAGIIAASCNNWGICGIAPKAKILPIKVLNKDGTGYISDALKGIAYVLKIYKIYHIPIVFNLSWGIYEYDELLFEAIRETIDKHIIFITSAGNDSLNLVQYPIYPACYKLENVIATTSINKEGFLSTFANFSSEFIDIAAPGENIFTCDLKNNFRKVSGTSFAAANVSGVTALIFSILPNITPENIKRLLWTSCIRNTALNDYIHNGCIINAYRSIFNLLAHHPGDINDDDNIDIIDALMLARIALSLNPPIDLLKGDVNCDTKIDITDALLIARKSLNLPTFDWCKQYFLSN